MTVPPPRPARAAETPTDDARASDARFAAAAAELVRRGADRTPHGRWSLLRHLSATYERLAGWSQPADVALGGLYHSAYGTDLFRTGFSSPPSATR